MTPAGGTIAHRVDAAAREATPAVLTLVLILLDVVPLRLPEFAVITPSFALMSVYYWTMYRAELMPAPVVLALGVFQDIVGGGPLGVGAFVLLATHGAVLTQRRVLMRRPFAVGWVGFVGVALAAFTLTWVIMAVLHLALFNPLAAGMQYVMTVALYPPVAWLLLAVHRSWVQAR
ncbi:MAG: rod shape-determining protein MreD [Alphaproteobacteria bacterium]|nr:rod shape-determining protein MreD [Alphaproteobacteria bacterium]